MFEAGTVGLREMLLGLGAAAALASVALSFRARPTLSRATLLLAGILGGAIWVPAIRNGWIGFLSDVRLSLTALTTSVGLWAAALRGTPPSLRRVTGIGLAATLIIALLTATAPQSGGPLEASFHMALVAQLLAGGTLVLGAIWVWIPGRWTRAQVARSISGIASLLQTLALLFYALGAQRTWGSYWHWTSWECWQLAAWIGTVILVVGSREMAWDRALAIAGTLLATGLALLALWGVTPLLGWLGQPAPLL